MRELPGTKDTSSIFSPFHHHSFDDVKLEKLDKKQIVGTLILTFFATLLTLPLLGVGGLATYRACKNMFTKTEPGEHNEKIMDIGKQVLNLNSAGFSESVTKFFKGKEFIMEDRRIENLSLMKGASGTVKRTIAVSEFKKFVEENKDKKEEGDNILHLLAKNTEPLFFQKLLEYIDPKIMKSLENEKNNEGKIPDFYSKDQKIETKLNQKISNEPPQKMVHQNPVESKRTEFKWGEGENLGELLKKQELKEQKIIEQNKEMIRKKLDEENPLN